MIHNRILESGGLSAAQDGGGEGRSQDFRRFLGIALVFLGVWQIILYFVQSHLAFNMLLDIKQLCFEIRLAYFIIDQLHVIG